MKGKFNFLIFSRSRKSNVNFASSITKAVISRSCLGFSFKNWRIFTLTFTYLLSNVFSFMVVYVHRLQFFVIGSRVVSFRQLTVNCQILLSVVVPGSIGCRLSDVGCVYCWLSRCRLLLTFSHCRCPALPTCIVYQIFVTIFPQVKRRVTTKQSVVFIRSAFITKLKVNSLFTFSKCSFSPCEWMKEKASAPGRQRRRNFVKFVRWKFVKLSHGLTFPLPVYCLQPCAGKSVPTQPIHTAYFFKTLFHVRISVHLTAYFPSPSTLIEKKIKFSSYTRKFRVEQLKSHICERAS